MAGRGWCSNTDAIFDLRQCASAAAWAHGPKDINPETGKPWALTFPLITVHDMVRAQKRLIDHLGIDQLFCVIGGSMGGIRRCNGRRVIRDGVRGDSRRRAARQFGAEHAFTSRPPGDHGRPRVVRGQYLDTTAGRRWLAVARMAAQSPICPRQRCTQIRPQPARPQGGHLGLRRDFQVESYLRHQGSTFVDRFDANSYLYITRAMDYFDLARAWRVAAGAFAGAISRFCIISFTSDWLFPTRKPELVHA